MFGISCNQDRLLHNESAHNVAYLFRSLHISSLACQKTNMGTHVAKLFALWTPIVSYIARFIVDLIIRLLPQPFSVFSVLLLFS